MHRGGNAEKLTFDCVIGLSKYSREVVGVKPKFDSSGFLFRSNLVGAKGFFNSEGVYLGSAFGTSTPTYAAYVKIHK